jgi:hypothetical protein
MNLSDDSSSSSSSSTNALFIINGAFLLDPTDYDPADSLVDMPNGPVDVSIIGDTGNDKTANTDDNRWVDGVRYVGVTDKAFPTMHCVETETGFFYQNRSDPTVPSSELWIRTDLLVTPRFFSATEVQSLMNDPNAASKTILDFQNVSSAEGTGRPNTRLGTMVQDAAWWNRVYTIATAKPRARQWAPRMRFRNATERIYLNFTFDQMSFEDFHVIARYVRGLTLASNGNFRYKTEVWLLPFNVNLPRQGNNGPVRVDLGGNLGVVQLVHVGSSPVGIYETWVDTNHSNANDKQECNKIIESFTSEQIGQVYQKIGDKLANKYLMETVRFYEQRNAQSSGTGRKKGTKRPRDSGNVTPEEIAGLKALYGSAPSEVTGLLYTDAPLDAEQIELQSTISSKSSVKQQREQSQKSVMAGQSASEVTCGSFGSE